MLGQAINLTSPLWFGKLQPGNYRVRASLVVAMHSFARNNPGYVDELARLHFVAPSTIEKQMVDRILVANDVVVTIE